MNRRYKAIQNNIEGIHRWQRIERMRSPALRAARGLVIIFGILDVFCAAFLVISLIASPGGPVSASVPVETLPAFEENLDHYGAAADNSETYTSGNSVVYNSPTAPETTAAVPETTAPTVPAAEDSTQLYAGFLFPDSATVLITEAEIAARANSKELCQRAINEIYAVMVISLRSRRIWIILTSLPGMLVCRK